MKAFAFQFDIKSDITMYALGYKTLYLDMFCKCFTVA